ncbi:hypothetical protein AHAS_Ahas16G0010900 [Arachis hypogaea]
MEKEDVVSSDGFDEADFARRNGFMLSYDLNKMPEENKFLYSGVSPGKKNAWHLAMWTTRLLVELVLVGQFIILENLGNVIFSQDCVRGSNFIRFSILIHPSPNSNTLNEGTTPANRSSRISRSNEDCLARVACWSPEAAGRSGVSAFWPILSAPKVAFIPGKIELSSLVPTWSATINTVSNGVKFIFPFSYAKFQIYFTP